MADSQNTGGQTPQPGEFPEDDSYAVADLESEHEGEETLSEGESVPEAELESEPTVSEDELIGALPEEEETPGGPLYTLYFGPSGGYGWLRIYLNGTFVKAIKAANNTLDPNGNRNRIGSAPCPPGTYNLRPDQNLSDRPGIYVQTPGTGRIAIFIHSTKPGTSFNWYPTQGCIRVGLEDLRWLKATLHGKACRLQVQDAHWSDGSRWRAQWPVRNGAG